MKGVSLVLLARCAGRNCCHALFHALCKRPPLLPRAPVIPQTLPSPFLQRAYCATFLDAAESSALGRAFFLPPLPLLAKRFPIALQPYCIYSKPLPTSS